MVSSLLHYLNILYRFLSYQSFALKIISTLVTSVIAFRLIDQISKDYYPNLLTHMARNPLHHLWKVSEWALCSPTHGQDHIFFLKVSGSSL